MGNKICQIFFELCRCVLRERIYIQRKNKVQYNPSLNLDSVKKQVNLAYDYFNNDHCLCNVVVRAYPNIKTKILKDRFSDTLATCYVEKNGTILSQFFSIELARRYGEQLYIKKRYGDVKYVMTEDSLNKQIIYKLSDDEVEIIIKEIKAV